MLERFNQQLAAGRNLSDADVRHSVDCLIDDKVSDIIKANFLVALAHKGETPDEIAAFARALRDKSIVPPLDAQTRSGEILDIVGTGGDRLGTFNISTTSAIICATAGVTVAKHGNRAVTSQAGSADVLETLGIPIDYTPAEAATALRRSGFAFFFAPNYHPAFKNIGPARKLCAERGQRTIFNFLGPLLNPAHPSAMLVGVPRAELCEPLARVLQSLGVRRAMVVCGQVHSQHCEGRDGHAFIDELSTLGENRIAEFYQERGFMASVLDAAPFPFQPATLKDLLGSDREANAQIIRDILRGEDCGPKRDAVLLNTSAALFVAGRVKSLIDGWELAAETIDSGRARAKLDELSKR